MHIHVRNVRTYIHTCIKCTCVCVHTCTHTHTQLGDQKLVFLQDNVCETIHRTLHRFGSVVNGSSRSKGGGNYNMLGQQLWKVPDADGKLQPLIVGWGPKASRSQRSAQQSMGTGLPSQALSFETTDQTWMVIQTRVGFQVSGPIRQIYCLHLRAFRTEDADGRLGLSSFKLVLPIQSQCTHLLSSDLAARTLGGLTSGLFWHFSTCPLGISHVMLTRLQRKLGVWLLKGLSPRQFYIWESGVALNASSITRGSFGLHCQITGLNGCMQWTGQLFPRINWDATEYPG